MAATSQSDHDAESLLALSKRIADFATGFQFLSQRFQIEGAPKLAVKKDDQRRRAIQFLNAFTAEVTRALDEHLEEADKYTAKAPPADAKKAHGFGIVVTRNRAGSLALRRDQNGKS